MVPQQRSQAGSGHVLTITVLAGVIVLALGTVTLISLYVNRVASSVQTMAKDEPIPGYVGRPSKPPTTGEPAIDYLVLVADGSGRLLSAQVIHLSGSRDALTVVGIPSDLLVAVEPGHDKTLATLYAKGASRVTRQVELLLGVRTDHQVTLGLDAFASVVDALGGLDGFAPGASDGKTVVTSVTDTADSSARATRVADLIRATLARMGVSEAVTNPMKFDKVLRALEKCLTVDSALTDAEFEATLVESKVKGEEIGTVTLATTAAAGGLTADTDHLGDLQDALADDTIDQHGTVAAVTAEKPR